jgi:geranylgeranyl diphosphate synthase type II
MDLAFYIQANINKINQTLESLVPESRLPHSALFQAARYALLSPGKRIRPLLTLATVETLKGNVNHALEPACAIELIHTYSLIHDDLPCMDNDDFRRGKPALHKVFPEGHALLTGDFLLTHAFYVLANISYLTSEQRLMLIAILANHAGGNGMIGGQVIDLQANNDLITFDILQTMHKMKTGELITAAVEFGAVIANVSLEHRKILKEFGQNIGIAFQIIDDILDHSQKDQKKSKFAPQDYVSFLGVNGAQEAAKKILQSAEEKLQMIPYDTKTLKELSHFMVYRTY